MLQQRGLVVEDPDHAAEWINKVGYYRLKGYGLHFRLHDVSGNLTESYQPGTRFEALIDLYEFDRHLRLLVLDAIERIEVAFRSRFNDTLASRHGSHWFMDPARFSDKRDEKTGELIFNHGDFLTKTSEEARRNKESLSIRHEHEQPKAMDCAVEGFADEAGDLPLHLAGGGSGFCAGGG
jgi:abortive infection bacteriophage resistance protein